MKQVTIKVDLPVDCTDEQFKEWIEFELGITSTIQCDNPLQDFYLNAEKVEIIQIGGK